MRQTIVDYDADADGPVYPWALERLRHHLPALLTRAGRPDLASDLDLPAVAAAVDEVVRGVAANLRAEAEAEAEADVAVAESR